MEVWTWLEVWADAAVVVTLLGLIVVVVKGGAADDATEEMLLDALRAEVVSVAGKVVDVVGFECDEAMIAAARPETTTRETISEIPSCFPINTFMEGNCV